jgi:hypothetical protein
VIIKTGIVLGILLALFAGMLLFMGAYLLKRRENKKLKQKVYTSEVEQKRALGDVEIAQKKEESARKKSVIRFFFQLRRDGAPSGFNDEDLKRMIEEAKSSHERSKEACAILGLGALVSVLLPEFEEILNELKSKNDGDKEAVSAWLMGDRNDLFKSLYSLGIMDLGDVESLYYWARDKYLLRKENVKKQD